MPVHRPVPEECTPSLYAIVAADSEGMPELIGHVGLLTAPLEEGNGTATVAHMKPPAVAGPDDARGAMPADAIADIPLSQAQRRIMAVELETIIDELRANRSPLAQYTVCPHERPPDDQVSRHRFSCVGFVTYLHRRVGIELLDISDPSCLPPIGRSQIEHAYGLDMSSRPRVGEHVGLAGEGPWPAVMPGYLLHAVAARDGADTPSPYRPQPGDEYFQPVAAVRRKPAVG